jgi:hypothetical protein
MATFTPEFSSDALKKVQDDFIAKSFKISNGSKSETIDIVTDYQWILDKKISSPHDFNVSDDGILSASKSCKTPVCYVVERKSATNAGIANILNALLAVQTNVQKSGDTLDNVFGLEKGTFGEVANKANAIIDRMLNSLIPAGMQTLLKQNNLNSGILSPYKYLYVTQATGKKFVFPLSNNFASFSPVRNAWGSSSKLPGFLGQAIDASMSILDGFSAGANLLNNLQGLTGGEGSDIGNNREMAKSYTFPQTGDKITTNFTLYNTTKVDAWKENYKFLFLFVLRNLPMRIDVSSFMPPLLYDVIIPSAKRLPVCCVENINIVPKGMIRTLTSKDFLETGSDITVNVPEAWEVTITFGSLISSTMNLILAGSHSGMKVQTTKVEETATLAS